MSNPCCHRQGLLSSVSSYLLSSRLYVSLPGASEVYLPTRQRKTQDRELGMGSGSWFCITLYTRLVRRRQSHQLIYYHRRRAMVTFVLMTSRLCLKQIYLGLHKTQSNNKKTKLGVSMEDVVIYKARSVRPSLRPFARQSVSPLVLPFLRPSICSNDQSRRV